MNKNVLGLVIGAAVVGVVLFMMSRPEPTPSERLAEATEEIKDATQEAVEAASEAVEEAITVTVDATKEKTEEMKVALAESLADMTEDVATISQDAQAQLKQFLNDWEASGVLTEAGIDLTKATEAVDASGLSADAKTQVNSVLTALQNAPGAFKEKLDALKALL